MWRSAALVALLAASASARCTVSPGKCYTDSRTARTLGSTTVGNVNPIQALTPEWCAQLCANKGLPLAGVEYAKECYCGR